MQYDEELFLAANSLLCSGELYTGSALAFRANPYTLDGDL